MFPKKQRISKQKEIEAVFKGKISVYNKLFGLKSIQNSLDYSRYTVIISTKVSKLAVERNRIKRAVKKILREQNKNIPKSVDCVIISLKEANKKETIEIEEAIKNLLKRAKLI